MFLSILWAATGTCHTGGLFLIALLHRNNFTRDTGFCSSRNLLPVIFSNRFEWVPEELKCYAVYQWTSRTTKRFFFLVRPELARPRCSTHSRDWNVRNQER